MKHPPQIRTLRPWNPAALCALSLLMTADSRVAGELPSHAQAGSSCAVDPRFFNYGPHRNDAEAEQLAMTASGQLRAPDSEYQRIQGDLALIRAQHPLLQSIIDDPDYVPDQLIVDLIGPGPWTNYQSLNDFYQVVDDQILFGQTHVLTYCDSINAPELANIYGQSPDVNYAEPNGMVGTDDFLTVSVNGSTYQYLIEDGYQDCFDGCDCRRYWTFDVTAAGQVTLLSYAQFDALGQCAFQAGACCTNGGVCSTAQAETCEQSGRTPWGPTVSCDADADGDGLDRACGDRCPADPNKTAPGACGCGQPDSDLNGDGDPDCIGVIPTVSSWGVIVLTLATLVAGSLVYKARANV